MVLSKLTIDTRVTKNVESGPAKNPQDIHPLTPVDERRNPMFADCFSITGQVYYDLPGPFLCASTSGMKCQMEVYDYDPNNILVKPMKSRTAAEHTVARNYIFSLIWR